jgi:hypothetical protein
MLMAFQKRENWQRNLTRCFFSIIQTSDKNEFLAIIDFFLFHQTDENSNKNSNVIEDSFGIPSAIPPEYTATILLGPL